MQQDLSKINGGIYTLSLKYVQYVVVLGGNAYLVVKWSRVVLNWFLIITFASQLCNTCADVFIVWKL